MKTRILYIITLLVLSAVSGVSAQERGNDIVNVESFGVTKTGNRINVDYILEYGNMIIKPNEQLVITPVIVNEGDTTELPAVVFRGGTKEKVVRRRYKLYGENPDYGIYEKVAFTNKELRHRKIRINHHNTRPNSETVHYSYSTPYDPSMVGSELFLRQDLTECGHFYPFYTSMMTIQAEPVDARVSFIVPEYEVEKRRNESMTAHVQFEQGKYEVKRNMADNARELDNIYGFTEKLVNNDDIEVNRIIIKGYASPEGSYASNARLSENRVKAIRDHLEYRYRLPNGIFVTDSEPEDWDSLRKWVAASGISYRSQVLDIIDNTPNPDARDAKIKALDKGVTYNMLLRDVYPGLRRVDYSIDYVVMPFTVEKGKEIIKTNPNLMNQHEFYMVADSYPFGSQQYEYALETAVRYYPDDVVANNNIAAMALKNNDLDKSKRYLERFENDPRTYNNMGIIKLREGDRQAAERYFRMAADRGSQEAGFNLEHIDSLK